MHLTQAGVRVALTALIVALSAAQGSAVTIHVPDDYGLGEAVLRSSSGDTVLVSSGVYYVDQSAASAEPGDVEPLELCPKVWGIVRTPDGAGPHPGVVLLHGAVGWRPEIVDLASELADSGFVALALDYYAGAERTPIRSAEKLAAWPAYQAAVRRGVEYLQSLSSVAGSPIGLIGFSRGAFLAVSVASAIPGVEALVDFYGGGGGGTSSLEEDAAALPAVLILHGDADRVVPVRFAYALRDAVEASGGDAELHVYPGAGHVFNLPYSATYSEEAAGDALRRTIRFLREHLETVPWDPDSIE